MPPFTVKGKIGRQRKWRPTPVFLPGESSVHWVAKSQTRLTLSLSHTHTHTSHTCHTHTCVEGGTQGFRLFSLSLVNYLGFPGGSSVKNPPVMQETWFNPWVGKIPWRREWQPTPVFLPGESHGQRSLVGYSPWCCKESA